MIGSYFGYQPIQPEAGPVLTVALRAKGRQPMADLSLRDAEGTVRWEESTEEGIDCDDLVENVALLIRLRLGPLAWGSKPPPAWIAVEPPPPAPLPAPPPALLALPPSAPAEDKPIRPADAPAAAPPKEEEEAPPWLPQPELSVTFVVAPWATPKLALGGGAGIGARWPFALVGFEFRGLAGLFAAENGYASTQPYMWMGVASACFTPRPFMLCGLGAFGRYSGTVDVATNISRFERQSTLRGWIGLRAGADWKLHDRFSLRFSVDGMIATNVETWNVIRPAGGESNVLWQTPEFFATIGVAGVVRF